MARTNFARDVDLEELWRETQQLQDTVAQLQARLKHYETAQQNGAPMPEPDDPERDEWDVWPYAWMRAMWRVAAPRFHSFQGKLYDWRLARHNRRRRHKFWQRPHAEAIRLRLT